MNDAKPQSQQKAHQGSTMLAGDLKHPFYKPLWRRIIIVATTALWFGFETIIAGSVFWAILSGAMWAYCSYVFLIAWKDTPPAE